MDRKQTILNVIEDTVAGFLYYDRKEDEDLPRGAIEDAIKNGEITSDEICKRFNSALRAYFDQPQE